MSSLTISLIQSNLYWEDKERNLQQFADKIAGLPASSQVVVLPEMFSTGFSMQPETFAETMDGTTVAWLRQTAKANRKIITGSMIVAEDGQYYNRLIWMQPDGTCYHYDKRHLFGFAGEDRHYTAGDKRLIVRVNGWKLCLQVCYDLRFPVWARQKGTPDSTDGLYDILLYVANWPQRRSLPWKTLLQARAIENQAYVIGVNRVGNDGNDIYHSGDSSLIDPLGNIIWQQADEEAVYTHTLRKEDLEQVRSQFPFLNDADPFMIL
ncbi:amidohydrolase [Taibaiella chishuiensis]|uniref:Omega-amidase YafV n=1 Tax=Taibaiella chishuiensis TaxID=1434707 RepID=A0A2P8CYU2_9BACT|nr:amidohydrolase [Taibaiella chishuiensis]PSK90130.1 putative amidohydrolase [Taibaiella chishuiensis]